MLDIFTTFGKLKAAWEKVQQKRREKLRPTLVALARDAATGKTGVVEEHLDKVLEASLPLSEVGSDLLRSVAEALEGKK